MTPIEPRAQEMSTFFKEAMGQSEMKVESAEWICVRWWA
jgi:hypothetical protein